MESRQWLALVWTASQFAQIGGFPESPGTFPRKPGRLPRKPGRNRREFAKKAGRTRSSNSNMPRMAQRRGTPGSVTEQVLKIQRELDLEGVAKKRTEVAQ